MGTEGNCCKCCSILTIPENWVKRTNCCAECNKTLTDVWTNICSDPIRTDTRTASVDVKMYTRELAVLTDLIQCVENPPGSGLYDCTVGGVPLGPCPTDALCGTTTYVQTTIQTLRLVARWKKIKQVDTLSRIMAQCDAETEPTCKWLLISKMCIRIEWGYKWFIDDAIDITNNSVCCKTTEVHTSVTAVSCATAAAEMSVQNTTNVCLTRSKYYTTEPTGIITLNPGDLADCNYDVELACLPNTSPTAGIDTDEIQLDSAGSSSDIPWTAPTCITTTTTSNCLYAYDDPALPCADFLLEDLSHTETFTTVAFTGSILGPLVGTYPMIFNVATCQGPDYCTNFIIVTRMECTNLSSNNSVHTGHTNRSILISLPAWTVDLTNCVAA